MMAKKKQMQQKWTDVQLDAIDSLDGSLIVSASAGSGKTAVLIERIMKRISDEKKPCSIDSLLVVTFTNAAANEIRERLNSALSKKIQADKTNNYLKRQQMMLPTAQIYTMDQFFNSLVKENFHSLGITPDYRILDDGEIAVMSSEAMDETLEEMYDEGSEEFLNLLELFGCDKNDKSLADGIEKLNGYSRAYSNPEKWIKNIVQSYSLKEPPQKTEFGKIILDKVKEHCRFALDLIAQGKEIIKDCPEFEKIYALLCDDECTANSVLKLCDGNEWDKLKAELESMSFGRFPSYRGENKDCYEKVYSQRLCNKARSVLKDLKGAIPANEKEYFEDLELLRPVVQKLIDVTLTFNEKFSQKKRDENAMDFNDIEHLALKLLVDENSCATALACELREQYTEILIDEYQDTNQAQDTIFCTLSNNKKNMFLVGDVKQSIYRFRLAMPEIFINRSVEWKNSQEEYPKSLNLDQNFRSRKGILDSVNYLFSKIMSKRIGDMVYDDNAALKAGAEYNESVEPETELCILEKNECEGYTEGDYIAYRIDSLLKSDVTVKEKDDSYRKVKYKDICILTRRRKPAAQIHEILKSYGIPSFFEDGSGFFDNTEVSVMLSFLSIIDNPLQDIPMLCVLMSPIFGFSADDIASIRVGCRNKKLYYAIRHSDSLNCREFIKTYEEYRRLSTVMSVSSLLRTIYENTGYLSVMSALENGENRKLNLLLLLEYASDYEGFAGNSLSGFIRFIERMKQNDTDLKPASKVSEYADVVRIMTVHKSKGLEFPVVFLADCGNKKSHFGSNLIIHEKTGAGLKVIDKKTFRKYNTVQYEASSCLQKMSDCSEELRILYVAMTRAREKLVLVATTPKDANELALECAACVQGKTINPVAIEKAGSFLELFLMGYMKHPYANDLRDLASYRGVSDKDDISPIYFSVVCPWFEKTDEKIECDEPQILPDAEMLKLIEEKTQYKYPFSALSAYPTKRSASSFNRIDNDDTFFACDTPQFAGKNNLNAASSGTAVHRFMEVCDFSEVKKDFQSEKTRLVSANKLTLQQAEVIDEQKINAFFDSPLYSRISNAEKVYREQKFTIFVPLSVAEENSPEEFQNEQILVQGVIDCAFVENGKIIVIDYKTDKIKTLSELEKRYHRQLEIYKIAAEQIFAVPVSELLLYSFYLDEQTEIKF